MGIRDFRGAVVILLCDHKILLVVEVVEEITCKVQPLALFIFFLFIKKILVKFVFKPEILHFLLCFFKVKQYKHN